MKFFCEKRLYFPESQDQKLKWLIVFASMISIIAFLSVKIFTSEYSLPYSDARVKASQIMQNAISTISAFHDSAGIPVDLATDPNRTGLIGSEISPIATTLGNLEAKQTTTNPNFAALIVRLLEEAGVVSGDTIAIGCSASFPALMIAALAAAQAMHVHPVFIISLGTSSFGATNPDFNLLHIYQILRQKNIFSVPPSAISLGGDLDIGRDFEPAIREQLIQQIKSSGIPFIYEPNLEKNVAQRMKFYEGNSSRLAAFVNIGGSYSNLGTSELVLNVKPGVTKSNSIPPKAERGVLFEMAARNVPIIHLLYIKGLALKYGLPWDPIPLPEPMVSESLGVKSNNDFRFWVIAGVYFSILIGLAGYGMRSNFHITER
jgi:poly-gamma-glutamate system protein